MAIFWHFCKTVTFHKRKTKRNIFKLELSLTWCWQWGTLIYFADEERNREAIDFTIFMSKADTHMSYELGHEFG